MRRHYLPLVMGLLLAGGPNAGAADKPASEDLVAQGKYLATAADCGACHTSPDRGAPMAGGYAIQSPLGNIVASNITPSTVSGIGDYSERDFARAVREGIDKQGRHLYPAMPYTSYSRITDADIHALYAYFMQGVQPVDTPAPQTQLPFPFNIRASMALWNRLFAGDTPLTPTPGIADNINRGDYLVNALAHCDTCHTPRNALMGQDNDKALSGGSLGSWYAPNITPDRNSGIGDWSDADLTQYLKTGHVGGKAQAAGPMAEAVEHSLQHLSDADIQAMVAYLRHIPAVDTGAAKPRDGYGQRSDSELTQRGQTDNIDAGWQVFSGSCANCHQADGQGNRLYPSLFHNSATGADRPDNLVAAILYGVRRNVNGEEIAMPAFGPEAHFSERLSDRQIADVSNYVLKHYGNPKISVSADRVKVIREGGDKPLLARLTSPAAMITAGIILLLALILLAVLITHKRRPHGAK